MLRWVVPAVLQRITSVTYLRAFYVNPTALNRALRRDCETGPKSERPLGNQTAVPEVPQMGRAISPSHDNGPAVTK
jgi:hypothetical protein